MWVFHYFTNWCTTRRAGMDVSAKCVPFIYFSSSEMNCLEGNTDGYTLKSGQVRSRSKCSKSQSGLQCYKHKKTRNQYFKTSLKFYSGWVSSCSGVPNGIRCTITGRTCRALGCTDGTCSSGACTKSKWAPTVSRKGKCTTERSIAPEIKLFH